MSESRGAAVKLSPDQITAVVLAGGFGTRIKHLLLGLPKPMVPVAGRPFVEWVARYLAQLGIRRVVLSTGHLAATVEQHFQLQPVKQLTVQCVPETQPLGTAGGFLNAIAAVPDKPAAWLVCNGDSLALAPLDKLFQSLAEPEMGGAILGLPAPDASRYGTILQNARDELGGFNEKKPGAGVINAGVYLFRAVEIEFFPRKMPLGFETDVFPALIERGVRLKVCVTDAPFLDIGTPESLSQAESFIRRNYNQFSNL